MYRMYTIGTSKSQLETHLHTDKNRYYTAIHMSWVCLLKFSTSGSGMTMTMLGFREDSKEEEPEKEKEKEKDDKVEDFSDLEPKEKER